MRLTQEVGILTTDIPRWCSALQGRILGKGRIKRHMGPHRVSHLLRMISFGCDFSSLHH